MRIWKFVLAVLSTFTGVSLAAETQDYPLSPMSFQKVALQDSFWLPRLELQAESTVPHALIPNRPSRTSAAAATTCTAGAENCRPRIALFRPICTR